LFGSSLIYTSWIGLSDSYKKLHLYDEALSACKKAIEINPRAANSWNSLGLLYYDLSRYDEAIEAFQKSIELAPKNSLIWGNLGIVYLISEDHDNAISAFNKSIELNSKFSYSILSLALCKRNNRDYFETEKLLDFVASFIATEPEYCQACYYIARGDIEKGLPLLQKGLLKNQTSISWAKNDPNFEVIREDPRFKEIVGA
jgi:tetratricopeptide (TPR) repeat protein